MLWHSDRNSPFVGENCAKSNRVFTVNQTNYFVFVCFCAWKKKWIHFRFMCAVFARRSPTMTMWPNCNRCIRVNRLPLCWKWYWAMTSWNPHHIQCVPSALPKWTITMRPSREPNQSNANWCGHIKPWIWNVMIHCRHAQTMCPKRPTIIERRIVQT